MLLFKRPTALLFVLVAAAVASAAVGWVAGDLLYAYIALGLSGVGLLIVAVRMWHDRKAAIMQGDDTSAVGEDSVDTETDDDNGTPSDSDDHDEVADPVPHSEAADAIVAGPLARNGDSRNVGGRSVLEISRTDSGGRDSDSVDMDDTPVYVIPGRKRFHQPNCHLLGQHEREAVTEIEALEEGFSRCSVCASCSTKGRTGIDATWLHNGDG